MTSPPRLILASRSPRRAELLRRLGLDFEVVPATIDETYIDHEMPADHAERLAREKASTIAARYPDALVVGSDTIVILDSDVLGKPRDPAEAVVMLQRLAGRTHEVYTGVAVASPAGIASGLERVTVHFRWLDREECEAYVATGEPLDKAGAYGIQGFGSALVRSIEGDYFAVMGLPVVRLLALLNRTGWRYAYGEGLKPVARVP
ncbi:MAG: septum formation inhibitor Maf [Gemmatimonas sp.]|nr:septum formation inhibitor Maf [Gemmatimonas sp.]